jgi:predicted RND superfamily exporter protein
MVVTGLAFNYTNIIALPLLLGIGVDSGIHIVQRAREGSSVSVRALLRSSTIRATILSAVTTIAGFGSLAFSAHPGTASLGLVLTIGLLMMLLTTVILLPALLALRAEADAD